MGEALGHDGTAESVAREPYKTWEYYMQYVDSGEVTLREAMQGYLYDVAKIGAVVIQNS